MSRHRKSSNICTQWTRFWFLAFLLLLFGVRTSHRHHRCLKLVIINQPFCKHKNISFDKESPGKMHLEKWLDPPTPSRFSPVRKEVWLPAKSARHPRFTLWTYIHYCPGGWKNATYMSLHLEAQNRPHVPSQAISWVSYPYHYFHVRIEILSSY